MQLIVSNPRYGSTHVTEHIHSKLRTHCRVHEFKGSKELLLDPPLWRRHAYERDIGKWSIEEKIKFIEDKKKDGIDVLYKLHAFHLFQNDWLYDWFKEFYKNDEIIVLKRKDLWRAFLSMTVHYQGHSKWQKYSQEDEENFILKSKNYKFYYDKMLMDKFFYYKECIDKVEGKVIYLEDTHILETNEMKWEIDYHTFFNNDDLLDMRADFNARNN